MKVNLINAQVSVERIVKNIERDNIRLARAELADLRKNAYNRQYYLEQKIKRENPQGMDYQILNSQLKQARRQYAEVKANVDIIREYIKAPEKFDFKTQRKNYYSAVKAFQRLNAAEAEKEAEKQVLRADQSRAGMVEGVTLLNIRKSEKINALLQNVIYNNSFFDFSEAELNEIASAIYRMTGYDLNAKIIDMFDTPQHYESNDGGGKNTATFDSLMDITKDLLNAKAGINRQTGKPFTPDELSELEGYINKFSAMYNKGA